MESKDLIKMWRDKAVSRNKIIKELKKRIKEKDASRDKWKNKYMSQKQEADKFKQEIEIIKKKVEKILSN